MPNLFAAAVVLCEEFRLVLLHKREDFRIWALPGGNLEEGETFEQGAIRETYEETGYHIEIDGYVGEYHHPQMRDVRYVYRGHVVGGKPIEKGAETFAVAWYLYHALPRGLAPSVKEIVADSIVGNRKPVMREKTYPLWQIVVFLSLIWLRDIRNRPLGRP